VNSVSNEERAYSLLAFLSSGMQKCMTLLHPVLKSFLGRDATNTFFTLHLAFHSDVEVSLRSCLFTLLDSFYALKARSENK
jgi:hypothetical protein